MPYSNLRNFLLLLQMNTGNFASSAPSVKVDGITSLMRAAEKGDLEEVKHLIPQEAGLRDKIGKTALIYAAEKGHIECARLLNSVEGEFVFEFVLRICPKTSPLMIAAMIGDINLVKQISAERKGWYLGFIDDYDFTALMYAAKYGHLECVEFLASHEAGVCACHGKTALMHAAENGHLGCVECLVRHEAGIQDDDDKTALMYAAENGHLDCVMCLALQERSMKCCQGKTALVYAAENGHFKCVKYLALQEEGIQDAPSKQ